ncbi:MAG TPA: hypothetical protein DCP63_02005 [Bacteroidetes bacterium]|nr:hypothetical protein [Bacteroidota bacterium]
MTRSGPLPEFPPWHVVSNRILAISKETKLALFLSFLLHVILLFSLLFVHIQPPSDREEPIVSLQLSVAREKSSTLPSTQPVRKTSLPHGKARSRMVERPTIVSAPDEQVNLTTPTFATSNVDSISALVRPLPAFSDFTFELLDSLTREYPALREALLKEVVFQSALRDDSVRTVNKRWLTLALARLEHPGSLEAGMLRNRQLFGTSYNPMRPPPFPNQVDLMALVSGILNLLRLAGGK